MGDVKVISGNTSSEVWRQIEEDFNDNPELFEYSIVIEQQGRSVGMDIDIDLGGGFEGGYALTRFMSNLRSFDDFRFSLHKQDIIDDVAKFFGMQDVVVGYPEFDKHIVVKSNKEDRIKDILSDAVVRENLLTLPEFNFHIRHHHSAHTEVESAFLELRIDDGITEPIRLREIYNMFIVVLDKVELDSSSFYKFL
ncbi:MAG: hypothetical protein ACO1N7_09620 [Sphingobacteriaceae bacterium]